MFEFSKKKPLIEGPIEFEAEVEIGRPALEVFPLIDVSSSGFAQIALGNTVRKVSDDTFELALAEMDELTFRMQVIERVEGQKHTAKVVIEPLFGNLVSAVEAYEIHSIDAESCAVKLVTKATFADQLSDEDMAGEIAMMSMAVEDDLAKLKIHAEHGVEAVHAYNEEQETGFDVEFDLGDLDIDWDDIDPEQ